MAEWEIDLDEFFDEAESNLLADFRALGLELLGRLILLTPVDTGRLRSAWLISVDGPSFEETAPGRGQGQLVKADITSRIYLQNNVEYGPYVNSGTERMAGRFFVEGAIEALQG